MVKPQGRRGEVAAELFTHVPERFGERRRLWALGPAGERRPLQLEEFRPHKGRMVLKFAGVDSIGEAEKLVGAEIQIAAEERAALGAGETYASDLAGCQVLASTGSAPEQEIGRVRQVQFGAGDAPLLVVEADDGRELLIPFAAEFVRELDVAGKRLRMALPEGMLDL